MIIGAAIVLLAAAPSYAQPERGYVGALGGFAVTPDTTSAAVVGEAGVRVAPHLLVFGDLGQFHNVQPSSLQPAVDSTTATLAATDGLDVTGTARVPAWYSVGGVRYEAPVVGRVMPYVLGGIGFARLTPTAQFTYSSGTLPDGTTPSIGDDVTSQLTSMGVFTTPAATTSFMFTLGGGIAVPVAQHWAVDAGYRFSRLGTDTPLNAQGATFGFGYRF
jgi:opacity protein-like surface antigen